MKDLWHISFTPLVSSLDIISSFGIASMIGDGGPIYALNHPMKVRSLQLVLMKSSSSLISEMGLWNFAYLLRTNRAMSLPSIGLLLQPLWTIFWQTVNIYTANWFQHSETVIIWWKHKLGAFPAFLSLKCNGACFLISVHNLLIHTTWFDCCTDFNGSILVAQGRSGLASEIYTQKSEWESCEYTENHKSNPTVLKITQNRYKMKWHFLIFWTGYRNVPWSHWPCWL